MSEATADAVETHDDSHDDHHPSDWEYVKIAAVLAVLTAIEVLTYFESVFTIFETRWVLLVTLFSLMIVKFWLVARMFESTSLLSAITEISISPPEGSSFSRTIVLRIASR